MPKLEYRSLVFEEEWVPEPEDEFFQVSPPLAIPPTLTLTLALTLTLTPAPSSQPQPSPSP